MLLLVVGVMLVAAIAYLAIAYSERSQTYGL